MCLLALVAGMKYIHLHNDLVQVNGIKHIQLHISPVKVNDFNGRSNKKTQKMKDVTRQHTH
jgi:hypothetical protein